jgi:hypothetical protein
MSLDQYDADELITVEAMVSLFPGTNVQTWAALRHKGNGPPYLKVMRRVYYRRRDVDAWLDGNLMVRTDLPHKEHARLHTARRV